MIANPKDPKIVMLSGLDVSDETLSIECDAAGESTPFVMSIVGGKEIAMSGSARALSRWALERGAKEVQFNFDLRFDP